MASRSFGSEEYRFGFNGKENDNETSTQDYGMRIYNPALGKFLSVDPLTNEYPWYTPYQFAGNKPIRAVDLDGCEEKNSNFIATVGFQVSFRKQTSYSITLGVGGAAMTSMAKVAFEGNLKANFNMTQKSGNMKLGFNYSFSGMVGTGNPLNMAGYATTGFSSSKSTTISDFSPSTGVQIVGSDVDGNTFKGIGLDYENDNNKSTSFSMSVIGRTSFGSLNKDYNITEGVAFDFDRNVTELGVNAAYNITSPSLSFEGTMLTSVNKFKSSGFFLSPNSEVNTTSKLNLQVGATAKFGNRPRIGFGAANISLTSGGSTTKSLFNFTGGYDKKDGVVVSGGGGISTEKNGKNGF